MFVVVVLLVSFWSLLVRVLVQTLILVLALVSALVLYQYHGVAVDDVVVGTAQPSLM